MRQEQNRVTQVRGGAPTKSPTIGVLASATGHSDCPMAMVSLASGVDLDKMCDNTPYQTPFGQDPQAFQRGQMFEARVKAHGYAEFLRMLREEAGFEIAQARLVDLRSWAPKNTQGLKLREVETRKLLRKIARGDADAPNLVDGAVLSVRIGSREAYFEADGLAASVQRRLHVAEIKSFPFTDGKCDGDKLGAAANQAAWYALLCRRALQDMGLDPGAIHDEGFIILPRGVGLLPTLLKQNLAQRIRRAAVLLQTAENASDLLNAIQGLSFPSPQDADSIDRLESMMDRLGTCYRSECLADCGLARLCRARTQERGLPSLCGTRVAQQMSGIANLQRAGDLIRGALPSVSELHASTGLTMAARMYDRIAQGGGL